MNLATSVIFSPGTDGEPAGREQICVLPQLGLLVVADSQTPQFGRVAARLAVDQVRGHVERNLDLIERFRRTPAPELRQELLEMLQEAFGRAAHEAFAFARRRGPLAVTLDVLLLAEHEAFVGHVGDGRVYLVRRGVVHQLTVDHLREGHQRWADGEFDAPSDPPREPAVLGPTPQVRPETLCIEIAPEDRFVVCGASIHRVLPDGLLHTRLCAEHLDRLPAILLDEAPYSPLLGACAQLDTGEPFTADSAQARLAVLAPMPLFAHCNDRELRNVAQATHPRRLRAGAIVFEQGQPGTELFLVLTGQLQVLRDGSPIADLGPGSTFGEMALLDDPVRSATVVVTEDAELMVISRQSFFAMLGSNPRLASKVLWNMLLGVSANLRRTNDRVAELERALASYSS